MFHGFGNLSSGKFCKSVGRIAEEVIDNINMRNLGKINKRLNR